MHQIYVHFILHNTYLRIITIVQHIVIIVAPHTPHTYTHFICEIIETIFHISIYTINIYNKQTKMTLFKKKS